MSNDGRCLDALGGGFAGDDSCFVCGDIESVKKKRDILLMAIIVLFTGFLAPCWFISAHRDISFACCFVGWCSQVLFKVIPFFGSFGAVLFYLSDKIGEVISVALGLILGSLAQIMGTIVLEALSYHAPCMGVLY